MSTETTTETQIEIVEAFLADVPAGVPAAQLEMAAERMESMAHRGVCPMRDGVKVLPATLLETARRLRERI